VTRRLDDGTVILEAEPEDPNGCALCGRVAELRPYGPRGAHICFFCGMEDPEGTARRFQQFVDGEEID
jgi:hypothetical protein